MKRVLLACRGLVGAGGIGERRRPAPALRSGPPQRAPVFMPVYNWTGFYVGINGGGGWGTRRWDSTGRFDVSGGLVGGTIGYNWQSRAVGVRPRGRPRLDQHQGHDRPRSAPLGCETRNTWLATVRGRVGYCGRPLPALRDRRPGGRRHPRRASPASPATTKPMPAGPSAAASNS